MVGSRLQPSRPAIPNVLVLGVAMAALGELPASFAHIADVQPRPLTALPVLFGRCPSGGWLWMTPALYWAGIQLWRDRKGGRRVSKRFDLTTS